MPKSKNRKGHKQKVAARRVTIKNEKAKAEKAQRDFIMNLIKQEQERGTFNNTPSGPIIDGPMLNGPVFDGPMSGPLSFDDDLLNTNVNESIIDVISEEVKPEKSDDN